MTTPPRPTTSVRVLGPVAGLCCAALLLSACGSGSGTGAAAAATSTGPRSSPTAGTGSASPTAVPSPGPASQAPAATGDPATVLGVSVTGAADLAKKPAVTSTGTDPVTSLTVQDLVVGTGTAATPTATVAVQYVGVLHSNGKQFDSSWDHGGQPVSFPLTGVVPGFTQGIGGTDGVQPMKVGGRRTIVVPAALGYPQGTPDGSIPPGATIVFVVDLTSVS